MAHGKSDAEMVRSTHNTARFFTETRHVSWVALLFTLAWGVYGYFSMPQRKDPDIPIRAAAAMISWPGASAEKIEQLVTRRVEEKIAENSKIDKITSNTRTGTSFVIIELQKEVTDPGKQFDDIKLKLDQLNDLPEGARIRFIKDFGDTATLLLTVASPRASEVEIALRARAVRETLEQARPAGAPGRVALVTGFPKSVPARVVRPAFRLFGQYAQEAGAVRDVRYFEGPGFIGLDAASSWADPKLISLVQSFVLERLRASEMHPDLWKPLTIRDPQKIEEQLQAAAGDRYSYRELKDHADLIKRTLLTVPVVAKVEISGVLPEQIYLDYSQERLASYGVKTSMLSDILQARNITLPGGVLEIGDKNMRIDPSGEFKSEQEIGDVLIPVADGHGSLYLRDMVDVVRSYQSPARYLNFFSRRAKDGSWPRTRAVTLSIQMRAGQQINRFGEQVDAALEA